MVSNDLFLEIVELVLMHRWRFKRKLTRADRLSEDLGMSGDDAEDFLRDYSKKFNVDLSEMHFDEYFASEGITLISFAKYLFGRQKYKSVTLGDLERFAIHGKWLKNE